MRLLYSIFVYLFGLLQMQNHHQQYLGLTDHVQPCLWFLKMRSVHEGGLCHHVASSLGFGVFSFSFPQLSPWRSVFALWEKHKGLLSVLVQ